MNTTRTARANISRRRKSFPPKRPLFFSSNSNANHIKEERRVFVLLLFTGIIIIIIIMATKLAQKIQITEQTSRTMVENQLRIGLDVVCYQRGTRERDLVFEFSFLFLLLVFFFSSFDVSFAKVLTFSSSSLFTALG